MEGMKKLLGFLLVLGLQGLVIGEVVWEELEHVQLFSGLHFQTKQDVIVYEATIPLVYTTSLKLDTPFLLEETKINHCPKVVNATGKICDLQKELNGLEREIKKFVRVQNSDYMLTSDAGRVKRGLTFVGSFFAWCCDFATQTQVTGLYDNQKSIQEHTNDIIDSVDIQYRDMVKTAAGLNNFTGNVKNITKNIQDSFKVMEKEIQNLGEYSLTGNLITLYAVTQRTWAYLLTNYYEDNISDILDKCHINVLSEKLLSKENLTDYLRELRSKAKSKDLELAIKPEQLMLYYKLPIAICKIVNDTLLVKLNIPLRSNKNTYEVYKTIRSPVVWENKICNIDLDEKLVIKTEEYIKVIYENDEFCNRKSYPLCLLPRGTLVSKSEQNCISALLRPETIGNIQKQCHYTCTEKPQYPIITKLLPNKFLITNIQDNVTLECNNTSQQIPKIKAGTLKLNIPCECEVRQSHIILLTKVKPCDAKDGYKDTTPVNLIPASWAKLKTLKLLPIEANINYTFSNLSEIIDKEWFINTPTFEITGRKKLDKVKLKNNEFDLFNNTQLLLYILIAWMGVLTILVGILLYCVHINSIMIKLKTPARDY